MNGSSVNGYLVNGGWAGLLVANLGEPLPFARGAFDEVVVSFVLHYLGGQGRAAG